MVSSDLGARPRQLDGTFERLFRLVPGLAIGGEFMIGLCSPQGHVCRIERGSGFFASLSSAGGPAVIEVGSGPLAKIVTGSEMELIVEGSALAKTDARLSQIGHGQLAVFRIGLAGDLAALLAYWQPAPVGPIAPEKLQAFRAVAELAGQAACAADLELDVQAQQLHLESLRNEIAEVQQFYRQFSDAIRQCFWVIDIDTGRVLVVSDNFKRVWGTHPQVLESGLTGFMTSVLPADRDRALADFHLNLGTEFETEFRVIADDGELRWIWLRGFPSRESLGARRIVLIADDITEKKVQEETLRDREAELVSRARVLAVGDLASGVAHEINNPLTVIVGKASAIKRQIEKGAPDFKSILALAEKIEEVSIRISQIVMSLKSLSRNEKSVTLQQASFARVAHDLRDVCSEKFKLASVRLEIPDFPTDLTAEMNTTMITQMLLNLLNNAFDAVAVERDKWVKVEFTDDKDSVYLFVTDSGPGIPIVHRSRIFDPFFTTKEPGKGTGLGLSLAATIAAHHNGILRLDTLHPFTRFVLQIPKKQK